jgi:trk system potassium uptake protein TrkH
LIDFRPVLFVLGNLLAILALAMCVPALVDLANGHRDAEIFFISAFVTGFVGVSLLLSNRPEGRVRLSVRHAFLVTAMSWIVIVAFAALPFSYGSRGLSYTDAYFEAMSGLTTTGATIMVGLDDMPMGTLLWRALLQGLGGAGIILMAVAILPFLRIGGMQLFRTESSDRSEKILPRISQIATAILSIYGSLLFTCTVALWMVGMTLFDAVCHALTAVSTAGYSTKDASIGYFQNPAVEVILTVFMILGGTTFLLYVRAWQGNYGALWRDSQVRLYIALLAGFSVLVGAWQWLVSGEPAADAFRLAAFNVTSVLTTTGYSSGDYGQWGSLPFSVFFFLMFVGGCTGSTAGGVKILRYNIVYAMARTQIEHLLHPHRVVVPTFNGRPISDGVVNSVVSFVALYFASMFGLALCFAMFDLDFITSLTAAASAVGNIGPGLGEIIGPAGTFEPLPNAAKWLFSLGMLLGRLEFLTVIVLFTRSFWRQ